MLLPHKVENLPLPFLVVCEGFGDASLICSLLGFKKIVNCSVGCPSNEGGAGSGKDAIPAYLKAIKGIIQTRENGLKGLLVVADADDDPTRTFKHIVAALKDAEFPVPSKPFAIEGNTFKIASYLIPGEGSKGTLEHLLLEAVLKKNPVLEKCLTSFDECAGGRIKSSSPNSQAKMRLSAIVAAFCSDNPWASAGLLWKSKCNPVSIESECFGPICAFLEAFVG